MCPAEAVKAIKEAVVRGADRAAKVVNGAAGATRTRIRVVSRTKAGRSKAAKADRAPAGAAWAGVRAAAKRSGRDLASLRGAVSTFPSSYALTEELPRETT
jgi:hypothetical protein